MGETKAGFINKKKRKKSSNQNEKLETKNIPKGDTRNARPRRG